MGAPIGVVDIHLQLEIAAPVKDSLPPLFFAPPLCVCVCVCVCVRVRARARVIVIT